MKQIDRVADVLRIWEDCLYIHEMQCRLHAKGPMPADAPLAWLTANGRGLRSIVNGPVPETFDINPYLTPEKAVKAAVSDLRMGIPFQVISWMFESRQAFRISRDLQALLNATSLRKITWDDIPWPSGALVVGLEEPLKDEKGRSFDTIMVNGAPVTNPETGETKSHIVFRLVSKDVANGPLDHAAKLRMSKACDDKRWNTLRGELDSARRRINGAHMATFSLQENEVADALVTDSVNDLLLRQHGKLCTCGSTHPEWDQAVRLVIGLCLYIDSLPEKSELVTEWKRCPNPVLQGAQWCEVLTDKPLTTELRRMFLGVRYLDGGGTRTTPAKFVPGYYRRPHRKKGDTGEDMRTKTERVRPYIALRSKASVDQGADLDQKLAEAQRAFEAETVPVTATDTNA